MFKGRRKGLSEKVKKIRLEIKKQLSQLKNKSVIDNEFYSWKYQ